MNSPPLKIVNCKVITPEKVIEGGVVFITGSAISAVIEKDIQTEYSIEIDGNGLYLAPGFIDIHVHGGGGYDFMDASEDAFLIIAQTHARYGTTAMLPTTLTSTKEELLRTLATYKATKNKNTNGSQFLGMHLEGPYLAMNQRGAQDPRFIRDPDPDEYREVLSKFSCVKRWSAAPELNGALEFGRYIKSKNVLPSIAHTDAIYEEALQAFLNGFSLVTHLYSAMSGVTRKNAYRYAGVIEAAYLIDEMDVEIIADGIHLPPPLLKLVYKIKGPDRIALITDSIRAAGMPEGESILGNKKNGFKVIVEDGVAKLPDRSSFAGSVATANRLVRTMTSMADVPLINAIKMITSTPARILNVHDRKGSIEAGKDADLVIFDSNLDIAMTMIAGKIVFSNKYILPSIARLSNNQFS